MPTVAALIAVNRLVDPRSERGIHHWLPGTALPELLDFPVARLTLNHLYRCLSLVEPHKRAIENHLAQQGRDLFHFRNDILLYDLTSTYFEGRLAHNPKAQRGYSRDHRPDCKQLCIGLVVNREGFPLGYESLAGKTRDAATLWPMLGTLEARFGRASRIVCFDRGMATEANLQRLRQSQRLYLCATRCRVVRQHLPAIRSQAWTIVRTTHAQRADHRGPGVAGRRTRARRDAGTLAVMPQRRLPSQGTTNVPGSPRQSPSACDEAASPGCRRHVHDQGRHLGQGQKAVGRTHDLRGIFSFTLQRTATGKELLVHENVAAIQDETDLQGVYLLRSTATELADDELWHTYMLVTRVEAAFRTLKTDLNLRPIFHHKEDRGDAPVLFSVLAYALSVTIHLRHRQHGPNLTTTALLEALRPIGLAELSFQTTDGNRLRFERAAVPTATQQAILQARSIGRSRPLSPPKPGGRTPPCSVEWRRKSLFINESYPQSVELGLNDNTAAVAGGGDGACLANGGLFISGTNSIVDDITNDPL